MLSNLIPSFLKARLTDYIRDVAQSTVYHPSHGDRDSYCIDASEALPPESDDGSEFPIPPVGLRLGYGSDAASYLAGGREHVESMAGVLQAGGFDISEAQRVLELGCATGRMIRHLRDVAPDAELWGTDIIADYVRWCRHNLSPPINFAVTTTIPHLPFPDAFFDLVYCGSVFSHIEDLEESWLLELARVLTPSGRLYVTIHDGNTVERLDSDYSDHWLATQLANNPVYSRNKHDFGMIVVGRGMGDTEVFYDVEYFREIVPPVFEWVAHRPNAYGYQSAVVLARRTD